MSEEEKKSILELHSVSKKVISEQPTIGGNSIQGGQYIMPIDIIISDSNTKLKINKGTKFIWNPNKKVASAKLDNGKILTYDPMENGESPDDGCTLEFKVNNEIIAWQWRDCIFGIVYKPDYKKEADKFWAFFDKYIKY
jgi:hypothetical protein